MLSCFLAYDFGGESAFVSLEIILLDSKMSALFDSILSSKSDTLSSPNLNSLGLAVLKWWTSNSSICSQKLTEQRLPVFSHEIVPDYLRTKPDPEVEEQEKQLTAEAARIGVEVAQVGPL